jgi:hypothetical protein
MTTESLEPATTPIHLSLPLDLAAAITQRAEQFGRSPEQTICELLRQTLNIPAPPAPVQPDEIQRLLAQAADTSTTNMKPRWRW